MLDFHNRPTLQHICKINVMSDGEAKKGGSFQSESNNSLKMWSEFASNHEGRGGGGLAGGGHCGVDGYCAQRESEPPCMRVGPIDGPIPIGPIGPLPFPLRRNGSPCIRMPLGPPFDHIGAALTGGLS
mmetsp:Transcript_63322/g.100591  ORF Transcript_63322/g.100591 Transcript_63322/m.100591 type:complete len:128 (+) Transcript_63322:380-763(+)